MIDETLNSTTNVTSPAVQGERFAPPGFVGGEIVLVRQFKSASDADWEVVVESRAVAATGDSLDWAVIGTYDQDDEEVDNFITVTRNQMVRVRHVSGTAVRCILRG